MKDNKKWPGLITLPGMEIPSSPPNSGPESQPAPPHVVAVPELDVEVFCVHMLSRTTVPDRT